MDKETLRELNNYKKELGINDLLFRNILAYSIMFGKDSMNKQLDDEKIIHIAKESMKRVDMSFVLNRFSRNYTTKTYSRSIVLKTIEELNKQSTKKR